MNLIFSIRTHYPERCSVSGRILLPEGVWCLVVFPRKSVPSERKAEMAAWGDLQPLSTEFYTLLRYGLFLVLLFHLPVIGVLIGGSTVSLLLNFLGKEKREPAYLRFSKELMGTALIGKSALFMFGIVPLLLVWFVYAPILFDPTMNR